MKKRALAFITTSTLFLSTLSGCGNTESANSQIADDTQKSNIAATSSIGSSDALLTADDYDLYLMSYTVDVVAAHTNMLQLIHNSTSEDIDARWIADLEGYELDGVKAIRKIQNMSAPSSRLVLHDRVLVYCQEAIDGFQEILDACGTTTTGDLQLGLDLVYSATQGLDRCVQGEENMLEEPQLLIRDNSNDSTGEISSKEFRP